MASRRDDHFADQEQQSAYDARLKSAVETWTKAVEKQHAVLKQVRLSVAFLASTILILIV